MSGNRIVFTFDKRVDLGTLRFRSFYLSIDGTDYDVETHTWDDGDQTSLIFAADRMSFTMVLGRQSPHPNPNISPLELTADQGVVVGYNREREPQQHWLRDASNRHVENFVWDVRSNRVIPPEQAAYAALGRYFERTGSLSSAERFVSDYLQNLNAKILAEGGLSALFKIGQPDEVRTAWGKPGTENWGQVGFPWGYPREICLETDAHGNCTKSKDMTEIWGSQHKCGGENQPGLSGGDHTRFFWACSHLTESGQETANSQWVPVKRPQPGVDYTADDRLNWERPNADNCVHGTEWDCLGGSRGSCRERAWDPLRETYIQRSAC